MNEPRALTPANENPWYVLATLYGEGVEKAHAKNRAAWNAWAGQNMAETERIGTVVEVQGDLSRRDWALVEISNAPSVEELSAWSEVKEEILAKFAKEWRTRNGAMSIPHLPEPDAKIDFSGIDFGKGICLDGFVFDSTVDFSHSKINDRGTFANAAFRKVSVFSNTKFIGYTIFDGAYFGGIAIFKDAELSGSSTFVRSNFKGSVQFSSATFDTTEFDRAEFSVSAKFDQVKISRGTFSKARFRCFASFHHAHFVDHVNFSAAEFSSVEDDYADFSKARFDGDAHFYDTEFFSLSKFDGVQFKGQALFKKAQFYGSAIFSAAHFHEGTTFEEAEFHGEANFAVTTFDGELVFDITKFKAGVRFNRASFDALTSFFGAEFSNQNSKHDIDFSNCNFAAPVTFRKAVFSVCFPVFAGTLMHDQTAFTADAAYWPSTVNQNFEEAREACAAIRHVIDRQGFREDAHFFFRCEMAFSSRTGTMLQRFPYILYGWLSDYGHSIYRPVVSLFVLWVIGFLVVFFDTNLDRIRAAWKLGSLYGIADAEQWEFSLPVGVSVANSLPFLGMGRLMYRGFYEEAAFHVKMLSALQSLLGAVFIFLIALGLRTRLRMS